MTNACALRPIALAKRRVWLRFEPEFRRRGTFLLHQQCGLWGFDVRREVDGQRHNVLLELGFHRVPSPEGVWGATTYTRNEENGSYVTLWAFGIRFGDHQGSLFLSRAGFSPRYSPSPVAAPAWRVSQLLETYRFPRRAGECLATLNYLVKALRWCVWYERVISTHFGSSYREQALRWWSNKTIMSHPATHTADAWEALADECVNKTHFYMRCLNEECELTRDTLLACQFPR